MILEFLAGTHPAAVSLGGWLDDHPWAALAVVALAMALTGCVEAM